MYITSVWILDEATTSTTQTTTTSSTPDETTETSTVEPQLTTEMTTLPDETTTEEQTTQATSELPYETTTTSVEEILPTVLLKILSKARSKIYCVATCQQMENCDTVMFVRDLMYCHLYSGTNLSAAENIYSSAIRFGNTFLEHGLWKRFEGNSTDFWMAISLFSYQILPWSGFLTTYSAYLYSFIRRKRKNSLLYFWSKLVIQYINHCRF